jgi:hypothetical protein
MYYTQLTAEEAIMMTDKLSALSKIERSHVLPEPMEEIEKKVLIARIVEEGLRGQNKGGPAATLLIADGYLKELKKRRKGKRPEIFLRRTKKKFNRTSLTLTRRVLEGAAAARAGQACATEAAHQVYAAWSDWRPPFCSR